MMGLFQVPVTTDLGVGRETFGLTMAVAQLLVGLAAPITGLLIDEHGAGRIIAACAMMTVAGLWLMHEATSGPMLIASGVLMGLGVSGTGLSALVGTIGRLSPPEKRQSAIASVGMAASAWRTSCCTCSSQLRLACVALRLARGLSCRPAPRSFPPPAARRSAALLRRTARFSRRGARLRLVEQGRPAPRH